MENPPSDEQARIERSAIIVATLSSFLGPFMFSSVNVALPAIENDLQLNAIQLSWIATAYLLATGVALVPAGKIADIHGRKKIFTIGLFIFTIGSLITIFVDTYLTLILSRLIQGVGAALFTTTGVAIISSIFPPNRRGKAIGAYVAAVYIGLSAGPFFGGILTQNFGWRSIFILMVPLGAGVILLTLSQLKGEWRGEPGQQFDIYSSILYALAILAVIYGATRLPSLPGISLLFTGCVLLYIFVKRQLSIRHPIFDVQLFTANRRFAYSSLAALLHYAATFAVTFLMSLYLQLIKGMPPQTAGTILMTQPVMMALLSPLAGRLADRIEVRLLATTGMIVTGIGVSFLITLSEQTELYLIIPYLIVIGAGFALFSSPNMTAIMASVEKRHYGIASGATATMRLLGQMLSMAYATIVLSVVIGQHSITPQNHDDFLFSIHVVYTISFLLCLIGIYFSWYRGSFNNT